MGERKPKCQEFRVILGYNEFGANLGYLRNLHHQKIERKKDKVCEVSSEPAIPFRGLAVT